MTSCTTLLKYQPYLAQHRPPQPTPLALSPPRNIESAFTSSGESPRPPMQQTILQWRHLPALRLVSNLRQQHLLPLHRHLLPSRQIHRPRASTISLSISHEPGATLAYTGHRVSFEWQSAHFAHQHRLRIRRHLRRPATACRAPSQSRHADRQTDAYPNPATAATNKHRYTPTGSSRSPPTSSPPQPDDSCPRTTFTFVTPSTLSNLPAGTAIGPGPGAAPGAGCGNAVDIAV